MKLVECVPNFSEGKDATILDAIAASIKAVKGVTLLDVDPGETTNRTVFTMVGQPDNVVEAAFRAIKKAGELIDMSKHHGAHARMGATDVCPFVPVSDMTMEECVELAKKLGKRVGEELDLPVYLYEYAASKPEWQNLAEVRKGEYEALPEKMKDDYWKPDFGPQKFDAKRGATAIGAREFLIAYNINLNTRDKAKAHDIALDIREKGRIKRDAKGKIVKDAKGKKVRTPGLFTHCKAVGWYIENFHKAQISINLTNYKITPAHVVLDKVRELAAAKGLFVTGSEIVGLLPKAAMIESGKYYLKKMGEGAGIPERMIIETAIQSMGLRDVAEFDMDSKIIEYAIADKGKLADMTLTQFADELSTDSPAPGGGSVAALCSAMSGALTAMVANLTAGKKGYEAHWDVARELAEAGQKIKERSLQAIDTDTQAFYDMVNAMRLPKKTDAEKAARHTAIQDTTKNAILVPLETLEIALDAAIRAEKIAEIGNANALSDAGVAAINANAAAKAAYLNVKINMSAIEDQEFKENILAKAEKLLNKVDTIALAVEADIKNRV